MMPRICGVWTCFPDVGPCPLIGVRSPVNIHLLWHVFWPKGRMHMPSYANGQESRASNRQTPNWMMICPANVRIIAHEKVALVDCAWNLLRASFDVCSNAQHDLTTPSRTYIFLFSLTEMIHAVNSTHIEVSKWCTLFWLPKIHFKGKHRQIPYFFKKVHTWLLRLGFMLAIRLVLRLRRRGLLSLGPPCGSFVWVNLATSLRTLLEPYGDITKSHVSVGNVLLNWN